MFKGCHPEFHSQWLSDNPTVGISQASGNPVYESPALTIQGQYTPAGKSDISRGSGGQATC